MVNGLVDRELAAAALKSIVFCKCGHGGGVMTRPFEVGTRVELANPPPRTGVVVGYIKERDMNQSSARVVVRMDGVDTVTIMPASFFRGEGIQR